MTTPLTDPENDPVFELIEDYDPDLEDEGDRRDDDTAKG